MKIVAGIGNYPDKYRFTRHNIGYDFVDYFRERNFPDEKFSKLLDSEFFQVRYAREDIIFLRPHTYMNLSGSSILRFCSKFMVKPEDVIVLHDDLDLNFGSLKIAFNKGDGGHNGISSIIENIGKKFYRIRIGINNSDYYTAAKKDFVLDVFRQDEMKLIGDVIYPDMEEIVRIFMKGNIVQAMNKFNSVRRERENGK